MRSKIIVCLTANVKGITIAPESKSLCGMTKLAQYLCSEEDLEVLAIGQDRVLRELVEEAVQSLPPCLDEFLIEALYHALHHKFLRQRLRKKNRA